MKDLLSAVRLLVRPNDFQRILFRVLSLCFGVIGNTAQLSHESQELIRVAMTELDLSPVLRTAS
jgi:hypothetical protein